jgi:hypothetical protein
MGSYPIDGFKKNGFENKVGDVPELEAGRIL